MQWVCEVVDAKRGKVPCPYCKKLQEAEGESVKLHLCVNGYLSPRLTDKPGTNVPW